MNESFLNVAETFLSIQGESSHAGRPCFFIRLSGCNLDCRFCDTLHARDGSASREMPLGEILRLALASGAGLAEVTGGEPMLQKNTPALCSLLLENGLDVLLETNGSVTLAEVPSGVVKIMDCKTPSSGEAGSLLEDNFRFLGPRDEIKFVVSDRADFDFALDLVRRRGLDKITGNLLFSPAWGILDPAELVGWMLSSTTMGRLNLQLHKVIWGPDKKGV